MAALVLGYTFLLFSANVLAITASFGLFFGTYDAATLPYSYVLLMFIGPLTSLVYLRLNSRFALSKALLIVHVVLLLSLLLLPLILNRFDAPVLRFLLPVYIEINIILTYTSFWNLLGRIYNLRQGKRLFPFLGSGEHLATIGAGFLATVFVARLGTVNLYWLGALCMLGAVGLLLLISRANSEKMEESGDGDEEETSPVSNMKGLVKDPYVRLLFATVTLYTISVVLVENLSFIEAEIRFPTAEGMATYVGLFMGIYGVLGLFVQWVIAGRALDRFGVSAVLLTLPGGLLIIFFIFALIGSFNAAAAALFWLASGANMYAYTLDAPYMAAKNVMLQPLPAHLRTQTQTTATGIAYPLATGLSGLLMLFLLNVLGFGSVQISYAIILVLVLWTLAVFQFGRVYVRHLRQALLARSLGSPALLQATDRTTVSVLEAALNDSQPSVVLYALETLAEIAPNLLPGRLPELLTYPDDNVRLAALAHIPGLSWPGAPPDAAALLAGQHSPAVRAAALRTWYAVRPREAGMNLAAYSHDPQPPVRQAALAIMRGQEDPALRQMAGEQLDALTQSPIPAERIMTAGVISELGGGEVEEQILLKLLKDEDPLVKRAALEAAAHLYSPMIWAAIIPELAKNSTRSLAASALIEGGEAVLPLLQSATQDPEQDSQIMVAIASICGRIATPEALEILKSLLNHQDASVRRQAVVGLSRSAYQAQDQERHLIEQLFHAHAADVAEIVAAQVDIGDERPVRLTAVALAQKRQEETDNLLLLLSFLYDPQTVLSAREALRLGQFDEEKRAYAIEMLDILLDHDHKKILFPFLRRLDREQRLAAAQKHFPQILIGREPRLRAFLADDSRVAARWLRLCAIYTLGLLEDRQATQAIFEALVQGSHDPVMVETALGSLEKTGQDQALQEVAAHLEQAPDLTLATALERWRGRDRQAMTLLQKADNLTQASIFATLTENSIEVIAGLMKVVTVRSGETIIRQGDLGDCMYVVVEGQLRVHVGERTLDTVGAGGVVGEMALLDAGPRSASVTGAAEASRLLRLDQGPFYDLFAANAQVAREFLHLLSGRLRDRTADLAQQAERESLRPVQSGVYGRLGSGPTIPLQAELRPVDKLLFLKSIPFFQSVEDDLLLQVAALLEEVNLAGGEQLFQQGDPGQSLYIMTAGQVRIHIGDRTLAYASEGEVIGEMALLESEPRLATVTGTVGTQLLRLDQRPFFELLEAQPDLTCAIIQILSGRLRARLLELSK